jgi:sporulation protein YlmC with PRC-barrel domain
MMRLRSFLAVAALAGTISLAPAVGWAAGAGTATPDWVSQQGAHWRATALTGLAVYNLQGQDLGTISDLLVDPQGRVTTAVLSVGGFLGIGGRLVGVPFERLRFLFRAADGSYVTADGQRITMTETSGTTPTPAPTPEPAPVRTNNVGSAVDNAGHAVVDAGRAVGHAAAVVGSAAAHDVGGAIERMQQTGASPARALLDASKDQLMQAPQFQYGPPA